MRALRPWLAAAVVAAALCGHQARAQQAGGYQGMAPEPAPASQPASVPVPKFETVVEASPMWTQDRNFLGTRFWKLDKGKFELELWYKANHPPPHDHTFAIELEIGLTRRLQLDLYENLALEKGADGTRTFSHKGNAVELRIAIPERYGQLWGNPVVYLEWVANHDAADRAEVRLLMGGQLFTPRLLGALNAVFECNADTMGGQPYQGEPEFGATAAASYEVLTNRMRLGAEVSAIFTRERFRNATTHREVALGPNLTWHILGPHLKLYTTLYFGLGGDAPRIAPWVILGTGW